MHYHCEIVIPPTADIEASIALVLKQYDENGDQDDEDYSPKHAFWDFWVIGGRWAGQKLMAQYDQAKLDQFHRWMEEEKITVSGLQFGKQELSPADQIPKVDKMWNEMFPSATPVPCPLFKHSNDQYGKGLSGSLPQDVTRLSDVPEHLKCSHVIFAKSAYNKGKWDGPPEAGFMLTDTAWNGCNHMPVAWDGTFKQALEMYRKNFIHAKQEYIDASSAKDDWLVVTVDYHS
jgi:hypothetical protein